MTPMKKTIASCIYCPAPPDGEEHWLIRAFGKFEGNSYLTGRVCNACNVRLGKIDQELVRSGHTGVARQVLGIKGRPGHEPRNTFEHKASQRESPVQLFTVDDDGTLTRVFDQALTRNPDGTLTGIRRRVLTITMPDGTEHDLPFPKGWGEAQLRAAAIEFGVLEGRPIAAHVPPPETPQQFKDSSKDIIRAVFGPFDLACYTTRTDGEVGPIRPTILRFELSADYKRAVAKAAFHYFLWACPEIGGDDGEFDSLRAFISDGVGDADMFAQRSESVVAYEDGSDRPDSHVFGAHCANDVVEVYIHFFVPAVGPTPPAFVARLGSRPKTLPRDWRRTHVAVYKAGIDGHDGVIGELR
jgi:hypothetical protein